MAQSNPQATKFSKIHTMSRPRQTPQKTQSSNKSISGSKRKISNPSPTSKLKRVASSAVLEAPEDKEASLDEGETSLENGDQAAQARLPAVNSEILPLPWKGRLGFAYESDRSLVTVGV
jgi:UV DNA damage endonuclease